MTGVIAPSGRQLLTRAEVAAEYGWTVQTLANWAWRASGPPYIKLARGSVRYRRSDIERWLEEHSVQPNGEDAAG